jgi:hypothetical protein
MTSFGARPISVSIAKRNCRGGKNSWRIAKIRIATPGEVFAEDEVMCRNIKTLFNFDPPVTPEEVRAASLQFVRKISGFTKPSKANEAAFQAAIDEISGISERLLRSMETNAAPKNREEEAAKAKARAAARFGD